MDQDWIFHKKLLAFTDTTDHNRAWIAKIIYQTLEEFEIVARVWCLNMNNASNKESMQIDAFRVSRYFETIKMYCIEELCLYFDVKKQSAQNCHKKSWLQMWRWKN